MAARRWGTSAFTKTVIRGIGGSLGRFLAIVGIVALGCGFFAGLQMCGPAMREAADALYDGTRLYDLRVVSTLGFGPDDIDRVRKVDGVEEVMPSISGDVMVRMGSTQLALRVSSLDVGAAQKSVAQGQSVVSSDDPRYLNHLFLREGRWPKGSQECVISADDQGLGVGVGDTVEVLYGSPDSADLLRERSLRIVGTVSSSMYPYTGSYGSTTLGSGSIGMYAYVHGEAFVDDTPYTELFVRVRGSQEFEGASDAYKRVVGAARDGIEADEGELSRKRLDDVRAKAQEELNEGKAEYAREEAKAQRELADAQKELDEAARELERGRKELEDGQVSYDEGIQELEASKAKLADARETLDASRAKIEQGRKERDDGEASWQAGKRELLAGIGLGPGASLTEARTQLEAQRAELLSGKEQLETGIAQAKAGVERAQGAAAQLEAGIASIDEQIAILPEGPQKQELIAQREALSVQLAQVQAQIGEGMAAVEQLEQKLAALPSTEKLDQALGAIAQLESTRAQLDAGAAELAAGERELAAGEREYGEGVKQLEQGQAELDAAAGELEGGRADLADGQAAYEDGLKELEQGRAEANEELAKARAELAEAQEDIDGLEPPDIYVLDRTQNEGVATHEADSRRIDSIATVFPLMFFLVAALVSLTTMTRMVADDRIEIGTYKALGYSKARIASKYLCYAGVAAASGATLGILALSQVLPMVVMSSYAIIYTIPLHPLPLPINMPIALTSGCVGVAVTLLATYAAVLASLREVPATLMLPRAPAAGKRIFLERLKPVWQRLSFSWKVTCRNLFRYKRRLAMTVVGIAGCTALLLVGFGLHDAIWDIIECQYGPIVRYDTTVGLKDGVSQADVEEVVHTLETVGSAHNIECVHSKNMQAGSVDRSAELLRVQVVVPQSDESLAQVLRLRNRQSGEDVRVSENAVVLTEKISLKYGLSVGDAVVLYEQDDIGNAVGEGHSLTITGIAENYVGNVMYVGRDAWKTISEDPPVFSTAYASTPDDAPLRERVASALHENQNVSTVVFSDETIQTYRNMLSVVDLVVVVLIASAGTLAFIVLYNLTNINIEERVREIASLKVLGFTKREVYAYLYREIALLVLMGDLLGMVLGTCLETFVVTTAEVDYVMFGRTIHPMSYVIGFLITLVFTAVILFVMRHKLDKVNMVESLKSVD
ncbi:MAG: FtsX-like permease family protein [Atopobiaceae bacterium]|nr:FtsX-like permease family protein [Atopobiaceae bacterium]